MLFSETVVSYVGLEVLMAVVMRDCIEVCLLDITPV